MQSNNFKVFNMSFYLKLNFVIMVFMNNNNAQSGTELNIVEILLRKDPARWIAGAMAGLLACVSMFIFVGFMSKTFGSGDFMYLPKLFAIPLIGSSALNFASNTSTLLTGFITLFCLGGFLGAVYSHVTGTNKIGPLFGMGLTWGFFSWVFISNLFSPSFRDIFAAEVHSGGAFFAWMVFGVTLVSVSFFDKIVRGK
jgi:hypothetical protein